EVCQGASSIRGNRHADALCSFANPTFQCGTFGECALNNLAVRLGCFHQGIVGIQHLIDQQDQDGALWHMGDILSQALFKTCTPLTSRPTFFTTPLTFSSLATLLRSLARSSRIECNFSLLGCCL